MKDQKISRRRLTVKRETLKQLSDDQLRQPAGGWFTDDCSAHPSHAQCSQSCAY